MLASIWRQRQVFDDVNAVFLGVSADPADEVGDRIINEFPDFLLFWDMDFAVSEKFGAAKEKSEAGTPFSPVTYILDPRLRVLAVMTNEGSPETLGNRVADFIARQPAARPPSPANVQAPILVVPRLFEPALCRELIKYYEDHGGEDSGFMREVDGLTVGVTDYSHKRRRDQELEDGELRNMCMHRIHDRLVPEIHKAFQFRATRMERHIVACYEAETSGHFRAHRDNTTKGTAHRRFAVSLILNTGEFEGGYLRFPEFGQHLYSAPTGGAVVFSCSLLHEATPVTSGKRYVYLPFLYDDAAAKIREENLKYVAKDI